MCPLELVKAARQAHGESTEVGSECDLWGAEKDVVDGKSVLVRTYSCTHSSGTSLS